MKRIAIIFLSLIFISPALTYSGRNKPPSKRELSQITKRGRLLAEYDAVAWQATDKLLKRKPNMKKLDKYIGRKIGKKWHVVFGELDKSKNQFHIYYEAIQQSNVDRFKIKKYNSPKEDTGYYLYAAKALDAAYDDFMKTVSPSRRYNILIIPAGKGRFWVYLVPAPTKKGIFPLGGDVRYLISKDGIKIIAKRRMHKGILEINYSKKKKPVMGFHVAILDDIPEDTDVFHVITRKPRIPQMVITLGKGWVYNISVFGKIKFLGNKDKVLGKKKKRKRH